MIKIKVIILFITRYLINKANNILYELNNCLGFFVINKEFFNIHHQAFITSPEKGLALYFVYLVPNLAKHSPKACYFFFSVYAFSYAHYIRES